MTKLSIDLHSDPNTIISFEQLTSITTGCLAALSGLGPLAELVEDFRVTFHSFNQSGADSAPCGPVFEVHYRDPLRRKGSYGTDYRFMGPGSPTPTANEI